MKKMFARASSIAISALVTAQMIPFAAIADDTGYSELTIHPYRISEDKWAVLAETNPNNNPTGTEERDKPVAEATGTAIDNMQFEVVQVTEDGAVITNGFSTTASAGVKIENIPDGYYKITPKNDKTDTKFQGVETFYVQLPTTDGEGHIYPKLVDNQNPENAEDNDTTDPEDTTDPTKVTNKHAIKLKKTLSDNASPTWSDSFYAEFAVLYKDSIGNWVGYDSSTKQYTNTYRTNSNGEIIIDGLPFGEYYFVETKAPTGYLLDQTPVEFTLDGSGTASAQIQSFKNDKELTAAMEIDMDGKGKNYNWTIKADIPDKSENIISYSIIDEYTNLKDPSVTSIYAVTGDNDENAVKLTLGTNPDYEVVKDANNNTMTIKLTEAGIAKLDGKNYLEIKVNSLADVDGTDEDITNKTYIKYQYAYDPDATPDPDVPGITDPDDVPGGAYPVTITYPDTSASGYDPNGPQTESVKPINLVLSNVASEDTTKELWGKFDISGYSYHADDFYKNNPDDPNEDVQDEGDLSDGLLLLKNVAPGEYTIKQVSTESKYNIDKTVKKIFIDKDGKVYTGTTADPTKLITPEADGSIKLTFTNTMKNAKFFLPFTGTTATIVFTTTGILIMAATAFFIFVVLKKKDEDDEEQENS